MAVTLGAKISVAWLALGGALLPALGADTQVADLTALLSDADCAVLACRDAVVVRPEMEGQIQTQGLTVPRSPYVTKGGTIIVFPGEAAVYDFPAATGTTLGPPHLFSRIVYSKFENPGPLPSPAFGVSFGTFHLGPDHSYPSYRITANFDRPVLYDITGTLLVEGRFVARRTETCVKLPNTPNDVIPPFISGPVLIGNFRIAPDADPQELTHDAKVMRCNFTADLPQ